MQTEIAVLLKPSSLLEAIISKAPGYQEHPVLDVSGEELPDPKIRVRRDFSAFYDCV